MTCIPPQCEPEQTHMRISAAKETLNGAVPPRLPRAKSLFSYQRCCRGQLWLTRTPCLQSPISQWYLGNAHGRGSVSRTQSKHLEHEASKKFKKRQNRALGRSDSKPGRSNDCTDKCRMGCKTLTDGSNRADQGDEGDIHKGRAETVTRPVDSEREARLAASECREQSAGNGDVSDGDKKRHRRDKEWSQHEDDEEERSVRSLRGFHATSSSPSSPSRSHPLSNLPHKLAQRRNLLPQYSRCKSRVLFNSVLPAGRLIVKQNSAQGCWEEGTGARVLKAGLC